MTDIYKAAQQALEALEKEPADYADWVRTMKAARSALRAALAEPDHIPDVGKMVAEPVAWVDVADAEHGPYEFHGIEKLPAGKHHLFAAPPFTAVPSLASVLDVYEQQTKALPCQHEIPERGCSTYNWQMAVVRDLRAMLHTAPEAPQPAKQPLTRVQAGGRRNQMTDNLRQVALAEPCEMDAMCLNCQPRGPNGECPDAAPQPAKQPLTNLEGLKLAYNHHWINNLSLRDAFLQGICDAEAAHGIAKV